MIIIEKTTKKIQEDRLTRSKERCVPYTQQFQCSLTIWFLLFVFPFLSKIPVPHLIQGTGHCNARHKLFSYYGHEDNDFNFRKQHQKTLRKQMKQKNSENKKDSKKQEASRRVFLYCIATRYVGVRGKGTMDGTGTFFPIAGDLSGIGGVKQGIECKSFNVLYGSQAASI